MESVYKKIFILALVGCLVCFGVGNVFATVTTPSSASSESMNNARNSLPLGSVYNDAKFGFDFTKTNTSKYTVTVKRKDDDFNNYTTQFIYTVTYSVEGRVFTATKYVLLEIGQKSVTINDSVNGKVQSVKSESYGIKFPSLDDITTDTSISDAVFNLKTEMYDYIWINRVLFRNTPYISYDFYRRDGKKMDCQVTIRRNIIAKLDNGLSDNSWAHLNIEPNTSLKTGKIYSFKMDLESYQTSPDEYYLEFRKT